MGGEYRVSPHTVQDPDDDEFGDLPNFTSLDPVDEAYVGEGRELAAGPDEAEAMALAERRTAARPDRWVNHAVAGEKYVDFVRGRRDTAQLGPQPVRRGRGSVGFFCSDAGLAGSLLVTVWAS
ncbi:hypothetical protein Daura_16385 [Dactylosporangium aurantiacum]|uniref:Uncharacterized protein n=2 Tax=Dactylosporangium aurantiacum TaxID=35754 RepID=A0A9Q9MQH7_9ACTN|nr:hypothetical protein Daura_16385 [Dactylosporangium aurantiacum]